ncbi:MAG: hypothetical protein EA382_16975 [Spirochaetaceae bacterium]|nr:MAG: hypothetical protein EA382_16975 [Spirochaetaceae bacterium]
MAGRFSSNDIEKILSRAVEIETSRGAERSDGIDRAELVRIATEAGIDQSAIERATAEYELVGDTKRTARDLKLTTARIVDGTLSTAARERVAMEIESAIGGSSRAVVSAGGVRLVTSSAETMRTGRQTSVDVTETGGSIRLVVRDDLSNLAAGLIGGIVGGVGGGVGFGVGIGVGIGALSSPLFAILFPALCIGASIFGARTLVRRLQRERSLRIEEAADRIAATIGECADAVTDAPRS